MKTFWLGLVFIGISVSNAWSAGQYIPPSPFENGKIILSENARERELVALLDMDCVAKEGLGSLTKFGSEAVLSDPFPKLKSHRKLFELKLKREISYERLSQLADSSACIIGISNNLKYQATATFSDPLVSSQDQHSSLHTAAFYQKASWLPVDSGARAVVAIVDTGVNYNHPDLANVMYRKDGALVGASFVTGISDFMDDNGHGTHVSGLAAAEAGNGVGGAGVCGMSCDLMPIKALDANGSGTTLAIDNGIFWAIDHGADVVNLSLGRSINFLGQAPMDVEAFRYALTKNVTVAVAAGNSGAVLDMNGVQSWPAMLAALPGVVSVASVDALSGALSTFSNRGSRYVEIAAPGAASSINGTYVGLLSTSKEGDYVKMSGTSMATPIVAGSMGLIISYLKQNKIPYTAWDIESLLKGGTRSDPALSSFVEGGRVLDLSVLADLLQQPLDHPFRLNIHDGLEGFVNDLYYVILRRNYDVGGAQFTLGLMKDQHIPLERLILNFFDSQEFKTGFGDLGNHETLSLLRTLNDHFIPDVYLAVVGHLPSAADLAYWSNYLTVYHNKNRYLIRALLNSCEFNSRAAGTTLYAYPRNEALSTDANQRCLAKDFPSGDFSFGTQVDFGYCIALERVADAGGRAFNLNLLKNGYKLEDVYLGLFRSREFYDLNDLGNATDADYVRILFYSILQRLPKDYELSYWQTQLATQTRDQVLTSIIGSAEFQALLKARGIKP